MKVIKKVVVGHVYKYEVVLWTLEKLRKIIFCYKMINFSLRELKFSGNMYFSYNERIASSKVERDLLLQRNEKKVTLLLIYHIGKTASICTVSLPQRTKIIKFSNLAQVSDFAWKMLSIGPMSMSL